MNTGELQPQELFFLLKCDQTRPCTLCSLSEQNFDGGAEEDKRLPRQSNASTTRRIFPNKFIRSII